MSGGPSVAQGTQTGAFYLPRNLVILPSPTPPTTSFQLKCFLPLLPNFFPLWLLRLSIIQKSVFNKMLVIIK